MEKKYDKRIDVIEQIINSKKNIKKLENSLKEPSTDEEKNLIHSIIKEEQEKIKKLENEKNTICLELEQKREKYQNQNQEMNKNIEEAQSEKEYYTNLILKDEKNGNNEITEDGKYKDAIQEHRTQKAKELDDKISELKSKIEKNDSFINEINKVFSLLDYEPKNKNEHDETKKDEIKKEEKSTINTEKEKYTKASQEIMKDISTDYSHTRFKTKKPDNIKLNLEENDIDKRNKEEFYKQRTSLPEEQVQGLYENVDEKDEVSNKKENIFKRIYEKIKSLNVLKNISTMFKKLKNKTKLLTAGKENKKEELIKDEMKSVETKKPVCEKVDVNNIIDVMNNAVNKKFGKDNEEKDREDNENEITL